jgi:hypothetical protein
MYNHHTNANHFGYDALNKIPGSVGLEIEKPDQDIKKYQN